MEFVQKGFSKVDIFTVVELVDPTLKNDFPEFCSVQP